MTADLHIRTRIRNYVCNRLIGKTAAENRVYNSVVLPTRGPFPQIGVYTLDDDTETETGDSPYTQDRIIKLEVQIEMLGKTGWENPADAICLKIERLVDFMLGGGIPELESCKYVSTKAIPKDDGEKITAVIVMTWDVKYTWEETPRQDPLTMDILKFIYNSYDMNDPNNGSGQAPDEQIDAQDIVGDLSE